MKKNNISIIYILMVLILILFFISSCSENDLSIFWLVKDVEKEIDNSLDNNLSVNSMVFDGANFIAAAGPCIWRRPATDTTWKKIEKPSNTIMCTSLVSTGAAAYAGFVLNTGYSGLYSTTASIPLKPVWTREDDGDAEIENKQIIKLFYKNSTLFISVKEITGSDPAQYSLYYLNGADYQATPIIDKSKPIRDVEWDGTDFWAVCDSAIYRGNSAGSLAAISGDPSDKIYSGILYDSSIPAIYAATESGTVHSYDYSLWSNSTAIEVDSSKVCFTTMVKIDTDILIGSAGYGYFYIRNNVLGSLTRPDTDTELKLLASSDLYTSIINGFFIYNTNTVYFLTGGDGLFFNSFSGSVWTGSFDRE